MVIHSDQPNTVQSKYISSKVNSVPNAKRGKKGKFYILKSNLFQSRLSNDQWLRHLQSSNKKMVSGSVLLVTRENDDDICKIFSDRLDY